jgi:hypothetical protein
MFADVQSLLVPRWSPHRHCSFSVGREERTIGTKNDTPDREVTTRDTDELSRLTVLHVDKDFD